MAICSRVPSQPRRSHTLSARGVFVRFNSRGPLVFSHEPGYVQVPVHLPAIDTLM